MKKVFKKSLSSLLALVMCLSVMPMSVFASDEVSENTEEEVYYSDLFYGHSIYLSSQYLVSYYDDTQYVLDTVYNEYMDSPTFTWSQIKNALSAAVDLKEYVNILADASGLTSFTYEKALDAANEEFAKKLLGSSELATVYGTEAKWLKNINKFLKVYDTFQKNYSVYEVTDEQIFIDVFEYFSDNYTFSSISVTQIQTLQEKILPNISDITKSLSVGATALTAAKALVFALLIEDMRMDLINDILSNQTSGTMLYDGMSRLKKQLKNGFVTYFYENYVEKKIVEKIEELIIKEIAGDVFSESVGFKLLSAVIKVGSFMVFDVIFDVPDIDDLTKQMVLSEYSCNLFSLLDKKQDVFKSQFTISDVESYETIFTAYVAATNAALDACEPLKLSTNEKELSEVKSEYCDVDVYSKHIDSSKELLKNTPKENRLYTKYDYWIIDKNTSLRSPSDTLESDSVYDSVNCTFYIWGFHNLTIPKDNSVEIEGDMVLYYGSSNSYSNKIYNYGELKLNGSIVSYSDETTGYKNYSTVINEGKLKISKNISVGRLKSDDENSLIEIGGNIDVLYNSLKYNGSIILNGTSQQTISTKSDFNNLSLLNKSEEGVVLNSDINIYGKYYSPYKAINLNGYKTTVNPNGLTADSYYDTVYFDQIVSDEIINKDLVINGDVIIRYKRITIPENVTVTINGNLNKLYTGSGSAYPLNINGRLNVIGNFNCGDCGHRVNMESENSYLYVQGDFDMNTGDNIIRATESNGTIEVKGNVSGFSNNYQTTNTFILSGDEKQTVSGENFYTIINNNMSDEGVVFSSAIKVNYLFNHKGRLFSLYNNGSGSTFVDYDYDGLKDNVDPEPTVGKPCTITIATEDIEKGTVSDSFDTVGGTTVTVEAEPTFKYDFYCWKNASGTIVSYNANYSFVATGDTALTAYFTKRQRNITTDTENGTLTVPSKAEIESTVTVTPVPDEGCIYTVDSITVNGEIIEGDTFIMPDEDVVVSAEFVVNDYYFALKEILTEAKEIDQTIYFSESVSVLQTAIDNAQNSLVNDISQEESDARISELQTAINDLVFITGTCGDFLTWSYDEESKTLSITGTGEMYDYTDSDSPWETLESEIENVYISRGVTSIGDNAFNNCGELIDVYYGYTEDEWNTILIGTNNECLTSANIRCHIHNFVGSITTSPTCVGEGVMTYTCDCSDVYTESIDALGHNYSTEWTIDVAVTCTTDGSKSHHCAVCDDKTDVTVIEALGHDYSEEWTIDIEVTCTTDGSKSHHCSKCDSISDETIIDAAGHIFIDDTCQICSALYNDICTDTFIHSFTNYVYDENGTETNPGTITAYCDYGCRSKRILDNINITTDNDTQTIHITGKGTVTRTHIEMFVESIDTVEYVIISEGISGIGSYTFDGFKNVKRIEMPSTISTVGDYAFKYCSSLKNIVFPESITSFGEYVLQGCSNLEKLTVPFVGAKYNNSATGNSNLLLGYFFGDVEYENSFSAKQWYNMLLSKTYYLPLSLSKITVLGGSLSYGTFYNCSSIDNIELGRNVTYISQRTFAGCTNLTSITITDSVTNISSTAFKKCSSLKYVFYSGSESDWFGITIGSDNTYLTDAAIHYNSTGHNYEIAEVLSTHPHANKYKCTDCKSIKFETVGYSDCGECTDEAETPIIATAASQIDYDNSIILTSIQNADDIFDVLGVSEDVSVVVDVSYAYGNLELYGTGTVITVFDGDDYIGDFTLIVEGDLNGDSVCDVLDAAQAQRYSAGFQEPTENEIYAANGCIVAEIDVNSYQNVVNMCLAS